MKPEYEEQPALLPEQLDAYITALLDDAQPSASGDDAQLVQDLLSLSHATPLRDGFADELRARLLTQAATVNQAQAVTKDAPLWGVFTSRGDVAPGQARRANPMFTFALAWAATVLLLVVLGVAFFRTPVNGQGATILSKVKAVAQDSAANGLSSYHGIISGWENSRTTNTGFTQTRHIELWYEAPDKLHSIFWANLINTLNVVQPTPDPAADTVENAIFNITISGTTGINWQASQKTAYLFAQSVDSSTLLIYSGQGKQTLLSEVGANATVKELGEDTIAGRKVIVVEAGPIKDETTANQSGSLTAWIDAQTYMQIAGEFHDSSGTTTSHWEYTTYEPNITIAPDEFSFVPPAGATQVWQRVMTFDEQVQRWREIAVQIAAGNTPFQVYMPSYTPANTLPAGPHVLGDPAAGVTMGYHTGPNYDAVLTINEGATATMNSVWSQGQPVQFGDLSGYYFEGEQRTLAFDSKDGTRIVLTGSISKEELLKVGGSLQRVGKPGQNPTETTPVPSVLGSPQPTATAYPGAVATWPSPLDQPIPITPIPAAVTIMLKREEARDVTGQIIPLKDGDMASAQALILKRMQILGLAKPQVDLEGADTFRVSYEGSADGQTVATTLSRTGLLEWVASGNQYMSPGEMLLGYTQIECKGSDCTNQNTSGKPYPVVIDNNDLDGAATRAEQDQLTGQRQLTLKLTPDGATKMAAHTSAHVGEYMPILLDGLVLASPLIQAPITGDNGVLSGLDEQTARDIEVVLRSGPLPIKLSIVAAGAGELPVK